jgi:hypothetical protein
MAFSDEENTTSIFTVKVYAEQAISKQKKLLLNLTIFCDKTP